MGPAQLRLGNLESGGAIEERKLLDNGLRHVALAVFDTAISVSNDEKQLSCSGGQCDVPIHAETVTPRRWSTRILVTRAGI